MGVYFEVILDGCVVSSKEDLHFDAEFAVFEVVGFEEFVVGEYFTSDEVWILFQPLFVHLFWVLFFVIVKQGVAHSYYYLL